MAPMSGRSSFCRVLSAASLLLLGLALVPRCTDAWKHKNFTVSDLEHIQLPLNLEYLEAEYFLWAAYGYGLDKIAPYLPQGGPEPIGVQKANLDNFTLDIVIQLGLQEVGHLRYIICISYADSVSTSFSKRIIQASNDDFAATPCQLYKKACWKIAQSIT